MSDHHVDVDTPETPIWSVRGFAAHVLTVTIGFLIALGLNSLVDLYQQHKIAAQARNYFQLEIAENRALVTKDLQNGEEARKTFVALIDYLQKRKAGQHPQLGGNFHIATASIVLSRAAWDTGLASQALTYMPFAQTASLARLYATQTEFAQVESDALRASFEMSSFGDPDAFSDAQIPQTLKTLQTSYAYQTSVLQIEHRLVGQYDETSQLLIH
ncbi:MAG TPA: hypothetical protein VIJ85_05405 [Rhizomicrobium sp.]